MPFSIFLLWIVVIMLAIAASSVAQRARKARISRFLSREILPISQWQSTYFPNTPKETIAECLATISRITGIDLGRLRPTDRFDKELKLPIGSFIAGEWDDIEDQIAKSRRHIQLEKKVLTIGDYIELMASIRQIYGSDS